MLVRAPEWATERKPQRATASQREPQGFSLALSDWESARQSQRVSYREQQIARNSQREYCHSGVTGLHERWWRVARIISHDSISNENLYCKVYTLIVGSPADQGYIPEVSGPRTKFHTIHVFQIFYLKYLRRTEKNMWKAGSWNPEIQNIILGWRDPRMKKS